MDELNKTKENQKASTLHTYAGDMATMVRDNEGSVIKIAMAEQKRREQEIRKEKIKTQTNMGVVFMLIALVLIGISIPIANYLKEEGKKRAMHEEIITELATLVPSDSQTIIPADTLVSTEDVVNAISKERAKENKSLIESVFFTLGNDTTKRLLTSSEFLAKIGSSIPQGLKMVLDKPFMIGIYRSVGGSDPHTFFIFKITSFDQAVAGSYAWEKTLLDEFYPFLNIPAGEDKKTLLEKNFEDIILYNNNMRVLTDDAKTPIMYSLFLNQNLFMITDSQDAIVEVAKRLRTENAKPL